MEIQDIKEYNKIVIEVAREVSLPWKWATFILSFLLAGMIILYFVCPAEVQLQANKNMDSYIVQDGYYKWLQR